MSDLKLSLFAKPKSCAQNKPKPHSTSANSRHRTRSKSLWPDQKQGCRLKPIADRHYLTDINCVTQSTGARSPSKANALPLKRTGENRQPKTKTDRRRERHPKMAKRFSNSKQMSLPYMWESGSPKKQKIARKPLKISQ